MQLLGMSELGLCLRRVQFPLREGELARLWEQLNPRHAPEVAMRALVQAVPSWGRFQKRAQSVGEPPAEKKVFPKNRTAFFLRQARLKEQEAERALKMALDKGRREMEFDCLHKMGEACEIARDLNLPVSFSAFKGADGSLKIHFIRLESGGPSDDAQVEEKQLISMEEFLREYKRLKRNQVSPAH